MDATCKGKHVKYQSSQHDSFSLCAGRSCRAACQGRFGTATSKKSNIYLDPRLNQGCMGIDKQLTGSPWKLRCTRVVKSGHLLLWVGSAFLAFDDLLDVLPAHVACLFLYQNFEQWRQLGIGILVSCLPESVLPYFWRRSIKLISKYMSSFLSRLRLSQHTHGCANHEMVKFEKVRGTLQQNPRTSRHA